MAAAALIGVGILAVLVFLLLGVVAELFRDVRQMRDALGILDRPQPVAIGDAAGAPPSRFGLPAELDDEPSALVMFLSDRCATCRVLAATMGGALPAGLWIVVEAASERSAADFVRDYRLEHAAGEGRVIIDREGSIAARLELTLSPVAYRVEEGVFRDAATVPSVRYLVSILPEPGAAPVGA
ncbi:MAG: hypothetical protein U0800_21690 [Isosphaeraceae bacterium]